MEYEQLVKAVTHRRDIPKLCNSLGFTGHGAEIGVQYGEFSVWMLAKSELSVFFSIDYWDHPKREPTANMADYLTAVARIGQYPGRSVIMRMEHTAAAALIPDESLDFVYYDIGFDKASVVEGINTWWPKVRKGGLFCGHIFHKVVLEDHTVEDTLAPREALADFLKEVNLPVHYTREVPGRGTNSWIVRKPIDF